MSDRNQRLRAVEDEEERERLAPPREPRHRGDDNLAAALQRLLGVVGFLGALFALGSWLEAVGLGRQFSTLSTIAILGTMGYWAQRRPDLLVLRAGPFGKVAEAANDSRQDIRRWTYRRPIRAGFLISVVYGLLIVILQEAMYFLLQGIADWRLAVAVGALIGSAVVAPQLYKAAQEHMSQGPADYHRGQEEEWDEEDEYEPDEEYDDVDEERERE